MNNIVGAVIHHGIARSQAVISGIEAHVPVVVIKIYVDVGLLAGNSEPLCLDQTKAIEVVCSIDFSGLFFFSKPITLITL